MQSAYCAECGRLRSCADGGRLRVGSGRWVARWERTGSSFRLRLRSGLVGVEGGADLVDLGAVDADGFVEDLGGDVELVGPVGHVGGNLGVDLVGVVRSLGVVFVGGVGRWFLGLLFVFDRIVFGHRGASCTA